jgi:hypothetical protein
VRLIEREKTVGKNREIKRVVVKNIALTCGGLFEMDWMGVEAFGGMNAFGQET